MPSPIWRTVPTSARSVSTSYCSIRSRRIDVISSGRSFKALSSCLHEFVSQSFQSPAHARIDAERARLQDDAADQVGVDLLRRLALASRRVFDLLQDRLRLGVGQLARRRQLDGQAALLARHQPLELLRDLLRLACPPLLGHDLEEVREQRLLVARDVGEDRALGARLELRIAQDGAQLRQLGSRSREVAQRLMHLREPARVLRGAEQRLGIDAVRDGYADSSRREKSRPAIASSISSWSRFASSVRPTTRDAASSVRSATSARICWSARAVSAAISFRVSSSRRCRSASVSSRIRCSIDSRVLRASARIDSAWPRASAMSFLCSSSSRCASSRASSAASIERRIASRRSSMSFWIAPKAYLRRTKRTIRKKTIVQIVSPGMDP